MRPSSNTQLPALTGLVAGRVVDRYRLEAVLGEGGMAVVWRVRHVDLGSPHAMKVLTLAAPSIQERLLQEGRVQASLRHPNVVSVTDVIRVDGAPALIMEFVHGPALDHLLYYYAPTLAQIDDIGAGILRGVQAAHALGLIHRDLKPANVLCQIDAEAIVPKVADFGLAKILDDSVHERALRTRSGVTMGTPTFMAPEQFRNAKHVDQRADVFSAGAILYQLLTRQPAFVGEDMIALFEAQMARAYTPVRQLRPDAPDRMVRAIEGALAPEVDERFADCAELLAVWRGEDTGSWAPLVPVGTGVWDTHAIGTIRTLVPEVAAVAAESSEPTWAEDLESVDATASAPPPGSRAPWLAAAGAAVVLLGLVVAVAIGGVAALVVVTSGTAGGAPEVADTEPAIDTGKPAPEATTEAGPGPVEPPAEPLPAPKESVPPVARPPVVSKPPQAVAAPPPPAAPGTASEEPAARVDVHGVLRAYVTNAAGTRSEAGAPVEPGTYEVWAFFEEGRPTRVRTGLTVAAGDVVQLSCEPVMQVCR